MSSKHQLSLELPESNNIRVMRIADTSSYSSDLPVDCATLSITSPGFNQPANIEVLKGFNLPLNACTLGLQSTGCGQATHPLPDGIYIIRYSVAPNDKSYVEYSHLRVTQTNNRYFNLLCELEMGACEPDADIKDRLEELNLIKSFIDAAVAKVEYCHEPEKGMELLTYAKKRLDKITNGLCSNNC